MLSLVLFLWLVKKLGLSAVHVLTCRDSYINPIKLGQVSIAYIFLYDPFRDKIFFIK